MVMPADQTDVPTSRPSVCVARQHTGSIYLPVPERQEFHPSSCYGKGMRSHIQMTGLGAMSCRSVILRGQPKTGAKIEEQLCRYARK